MMASTMMASERRGQALILAGTTGSGKTTTCKTLVGMADDLWLHFGIDLFLGTVVPRLYVDGGPRCEEGVHMVSVDPADPSGPRRMVLGSRGRDMIASFHAMVAAGVRAGQNLLVDHVTTLDPPILQDCLERLRGLDVFFVCLAPPDAVIPERIDARLESVVELLGREQAIHTNANTKRIARYMSAQIHAHDCYDLVVDTSVHDPQGVARLILDAVAARPGTAFAELARRLDAGTAPFAIAPAAAREGE